MDKNLVGENKQKLLAEQKRLRSILGFDAIAEGDGEFPGEFKPRFQEFGNKNDENANESTAFETDLAITSDLEDRLKKVEAALKRIEQGTYGKCREGDDVEEARLMAVPEADTCFKHSV